MKKLLPILLFGILTVHYSNATDVSGLISTNTTWTKANSPYVVTGNILVPEGIMLTIEPGTEIRFDASKVLQINGTVVARGSSSDSIRFTSNTVQEPGAWGSITFNNSSIDAELDNNGNYVSGCALEYCIVEYGGKIDDNTNCSMIQLSDALPYINNCSIKSSLNVGLEIINYSYDYSNYSIKGMAFVNCKEGLLSKYCSWGYLILDQCSFINNGLAASSRYMAMASFDNCKFSFNTMILEIQGNTTIKNSEFSDNSSPDGYFTIKNEGNFEFIHNMVYRNTGFILSDMGHVNVSSNIFVENYSPIPPHYFTNLVQVLAGSFIVANNIFTNNYNICPLFLRSESNHESIVKNNFFTNNYLDSPIIDFAKYESYQDTGKIEFKGNVATQNISPSGSLTSFSGTLKLDSNNLYNNSSAYIIKNANSPSYLPYLNISNNYWGVNTTDELSEVVYDFFDDANLGITVFDNVLLNPPAQSPVLPPAQVKKTDMGNGNVKVSWDSNPDDAIGYNVYWGNYSAYTFAQMADAGTATSYIVNGVSINDRIAVTAYDSDYIHGKKSHTWQNDNMLSGHESPYSFDIEDLLGVSNPESPSAFNFYPNPVNDGLIIEIDKNTSTQYLNIINLQGQILKTALLVEQKTEINLNDLPSGMYLIQLCGKNGCTTEKLIKL